MREEVGAPKYQPAWKHKSRKLFFPTKKHQLLSHHFLRWLFTFVKYFWKLSLVHNMSIIRHRGAEYASCWGATVNIWHALQCGELLFRSGGRVKRARFKHSAVWLFGLTEFQKWKKQIIKAICTYWRGGVSPWMYALMHQQNTTASIQVVRGLSLQMHTQKGNPPLPAPHPLAVTVWSNLPAWKMQKIKLDHGRRNNNLNVLCVCVCGSDGRKKPTGDHPSPDGASEHRYAKSCGCTVCPAGELLSENNVLLLSLAHINFVHKDYPPSTCVDA